METKYDLYLTDLIHRDTLQKMQDAFARLTGMAIILIFTGSGISVSTWPPMTQPTSLPSTMIGDAKFIRLNIMFIRRRRIWSVPRI